MSAFEYQALDANGRTKKGVITADAPRQARDKLREQGLTPIKLIPVSDSGRLHNDSKIKSSDGGSRHKINATEFTVLMRQLATLLGSGITIEESLSSLIKQAESIQTQAVVTGIRSAVMEGRSLAESMALYPKSFNELYVATISAGEQTGKLPEIMDRLADYTESKQQLQRAIIGKMIYPIIIIVVAILVVTGLVTFIVPKVVQVYVDNNQALPLITQIVISISDFFQQYGIFLIIGICLAVFAWIATFRQPLKRLWLDEQILKLPMFKKLVRGMNSARMARTLSIMVGSGVPLIAAMKSSSRVITNKFMRQAMENATTQVSEGVSLGRALERSSVFTPMLVQMVYSGEASGKLDVMLDKAAISSENELEMRINAFVNLFEPIMILIMAVIVFIIVVAILLPILDLNQQF